LLLSVVPTELILKKRDRMLSFSLFTGLKPVVIICRSYGTHS
jgi:hypothetical protein